MTSKGPPIVTYRITLPESGEDLGKWLERNNATFEVCCQLGKYTVSVALNFPGSHTENGNASVTKSSRVVVSTHGDTFQTTLTEALRLAAAQVKP